MKLPLFGIRGAVPLASEEVEVERPVPGHYELGRYVEPDPEVIKVEASVQTAGNKDLEDVDEGRRVNGGVKLYTTTELRTSSPDGRTQGDIIKWSGDRWLVEKVFDWFTDGGYYKVLATRVGT